MLFYLILFNRCREDWLFLKGNDVSNRKVILRFEYWFFDFKLRIKFILLRIFLVVIDYWVDWVNEICFFNIGFFLLGKMFIKGWVILFV